METLSPGITGRHRGGNQLEPLAASPREACTLLNLGLTRLYQLIRNDELDSYLDGSSRRITMESIHRRLERLLANARTTESTDKTQRRRPPSRKQSRKSEHSRAERPSRVPVAKSRV